MFDTETYKKHLQNGAEILYLCTENDHFGNPRRGYFHTKTETFYDEGYAGHHAVPENLRKAAYFAEFEHRIDLSVDEYEATLNVIQIANLLFN